MTTACKSTLYSEQTEGKRPQGAFIQSAGPKLGPADCMKAPNAALSAPRSNSRRPFDTSYTDENAWNVEMNFFLTNHVAGFHQSSLSNRI